MSPAEIAKSEKEFHHTWGDRELPAVFVVSAGTLEGAYELNDAIYAAAVKAIGKENFNSFASIWPGIIKRQANLKAWNEFWSAEKKKEFQELLVEYGQPYNFSDEAFAPFIQQLNSPASLEMEPQGLAFFEQLKEQELELKTQQNQSVHLYS